MAMRTTIYCNDVIESKLNELLIKAKTDPANWSLKTGKAAPSNTNQLISVLIEIGYDLLIDQPAVSALAEERPVWETVADIGASLPEEAWDDIPDDLAINLDYYLYGVTDE